MIKPPKKPKPIELKVLMEGNHTTPVIAIVIVVILLGISASTLI